MSLKQKLSGALAGLPLFSFGRQSLDVAEGQQQLRCELVALDSLACAFEDLNLTSARLKTLTIDELKQVAEQLSKRLTYLLEPISPIEFDAAGAVVQMRSNPPQKGDDGTTYYELLVNRAGTLNLCRYRRPAGQLRTLVPANVTREVLLRLADDLSAVG